MKKREEIIRLWFSMWIEQKDLGIGDIFAEDVIYTESWGHKYKNRKTVEHWFNEWNTRGRVLIWDIKQFIHQGNQTVVEWYFKNNMNNGNIEEFDGVSLILWTEDNKIKANMVITLRSGTKSQTGFDVSNKLAQPCPYIGTVLPFHRKSISVILCTVKTL